MKKIGISLLILFLSVLQISAKTVQKTITPEEKNAMLNEAEDWIDDMLEGSQDIKTDAILHAMRGFSSEIQRYRKTVKEEPDEESNNVSKKVIMGGGSGNIRMKVYGEKETEIKNLLIFFHGGGWSLGSIEDSEDFCMALAKEGKTIVVAVDYLLAPENPYPNGLKNCIEAVNYLSKEAKELGSSSDRISLGGEGAGGNLAISTALKMEETDDVMIKSVVVYYPILKAAVDKEKPSWRKYAKGYGFDSRYLEAASGSYIKGMEFSQTENNWEDPFISPLLAEDARILKLPPVLIIAAGRDILIDWEEEFSSKSDNIEMVVFEDSIHGFLSDGQQKTAFKKAVELTEEFLQNSD